LPAAASLNMLPLSGEVDMAADAPGATPRREVSWGGRLLGLGILGVAVIVVIGRENAGVTEHALPILGVALLCAVGIPMALFRRVVED
jgi:hypothetical protein